MDEHVPVAGIPAPHRSLTSTIADAAQAAVVPSSGVESGLPVDDLYEYIAQRGFHFPREIVTRYLVALRSKPFVLFSGISGTGKTRLALLVAEYYAQRGGVPAVRRERPMDGPHDFYIPIDAVTLRSGTLTPTREQRDYFDPTIEGTSTFIGNVTNILGGHGETTFRTSSTVFGGRRRLTVQVPANLRRALDENGVRSTDYLHFHVVDEHKRYDIALFRPETSLVDLPATDRYAFVSVRPSWDDHTALLGHWDEEHERYARSPVLELLLRAGREHRDAVAAGVEPAPYFIVLDEMNIARIEQYFSDFLSALESRRADGSGRIRQEPMHLHSADAALPVWIDRHGIEYDIPEQFEIPMNVLITGTVNLDSSTHPLSPKVVDRASVIAFNAVDFTRFLGGDSAAGDESPLQLTGDATRSLPLGELCLSSAEESRRVGPWLGPFIELNDMLATYDLHVGYRVLGDVARFVAEATERIGIDDEVVTAALDSAITHKLVARLATDPVPPPAVLLDDLVRACVGSDAVVVLTSDDEAVRRDGGRVHLPRSAGGLLRLRNSVVARAGVPEVRAA